LKLVKGNLHPTFDFLHDREDDHDKGHYMFTQRQLSSLAVLVGLTAASSFAQSVVSAHSGTLHYFDGDVSIDGEAVVAKVGKFPAIKENGILKTGLGRAEVLLTPGVFLRLGENSSIKMLDTRLMSTRVELLSGTAMVDSNDPDGSVKDPAVTIIYKSYEIQPLKTGIFEVSSEASHLKVFKGQASVVAGNNRVVVKDGRLMPFAAGLVTEKFDEKLGDDLYLWARDRSAYLSAANMSSARSLASSGSNGSYPAMLGFDPGFRGGWYYNSYLNMYTYMPMGGTSWSPFGYGYYSPYTIGNYYQPNNYYWYGGNSRGSSSGVPLTNIGTSSLAAAQVARIGAGGNTHPTLSSPVRGADGFSGTNSSRGFADAASQRGGFGNNGFGNGNSNPGYNSAMTTSGTGNAGSFSPAVSGGGGAGSAPAGGGNVGGGARGK
jgi:hypothetical protein